MMKLEIWDNLGLKFRHSLNEILSSCRRAISSIFRPIYLIFTIFVSEFLIAKFDHYLTLTKFTATLLDLSDEILQHVQFQELELS